VQELGFGTGGSTSIAHHGTNVAGIVHDVAPGVRIVSLDVFSGDFAPSNSILAGLNWCLANRQAYGLVAVNMSIVGSSYTEPCSTDPIETAISNLLAVNILTTVSAGNDGYADRLSYPACAPSALSVGAVWAASFGSQTFNDPPHPVCTDPLTAADEITCFSQSASFLTLLAPGALITAAGQTYEGTSQAAPHVAGSVAVIRSANPTESLFTTVKRLVTTGAQVSDARNGLVKPRLNLAGAIFGPLPSCHGTSVSLPLSTTGSLTSNGGCLDSDNGGRLYYANNYQFAGAAGQSLTVALSSSVFRTVLLLVAPGGSIAQDVTANPALLTYTLPSTGTWTLNVTSGWPGVTGPYSLTASLTTPGQPCVANATTLCIDDQFGDKRFKVQVVFQTSQGAGAAGNGQAISLSSLGVPHGGLLWFFSADNPELLIKVLPACPVNGSHWVFASAGTNVGLTITVTDTSTGAQKVYTNADLHAMIPIQDIGAFACP
jgi:subtilisin family serine protease